MSSLRATGDERGVSFRGQELAEGRADILIAIDDEDHHKLCTQSGAVAVKTGFQRFRGGAIDVRSIGGKITASDRAVDDANRYNAPAMIEATRPARRAAAAGEPRLSIPEHSCPKDGGHTSSSFVDPAAPLRTRAGILRARPARILLSLL